MRILLLAIVALLSNVALAREDPYACYEKAITDQDFSRCAARDANDAGKVLSGVYGALQKRYRQNPPALDGLRRAQELWRSWRDAEIEAWYPGGQQRHGNAVDQCSSGVEYRLTNERSGQLRKPLNAAPASASCAQVDARPADQELNRVYRGIVKQYARDPLFLQALKSAEQAWIRWRDAEVKSQALSLRRCEAEVIHEMTLARTKQLQAWLDGAENEDVCNGSLQPQGCLHGDPEACNWE
jgi:uncharacterized protein YecT (DUF1311 family)